MVDDLLAFATGRFDFITQLRFVEGLAGFQQTLGAGFVQFLLGQVIFAAADAFGLGVGNGGISNTIRIERVNEHLAQCAHTQAAGLLFDACLRFGVELLGQSHQTIGQTQYGFFITGAHGNAGEQVFERHAGLFFQRARVGLAGFFYAYGVDQYEAALGAVGAVGYFAQ